MINNCNLNPLVGKPLNMQNKTARSWTFTSFADNIEPKAEAIKYAIYQREVAPETGREHWQGYMTLKSSVRMPAAKKIVGDDAAHMEIAKGNLDQNYAYCTKSESRKDGTEPIEIGQRSNMGQGKRAVKNACHNVTCHKVAGNTKPPLCSICLQIINR